MHTAAPTWSDTTPDGRWRGYAYDELVARDKASLDNWWRETMRASTSSGSRTTAPPTADNLPPPEMIAQEIVEDLEAALEQFRLIAGDLGARPEVAGEETS